MTDQPKWTKGPWALLVEQSYRPECTVATIEQAGEDLPYRGMIARLQSAEHIDGIDGAELTANAHLLAAAPDMATVLEYYADQFCEGFCKDLPQAGTYQPEMDLDCSGCKARAALAKARGQA